MAAAAYRRLAKRRSADVLIEDQRLAQDVFSEYS